LRFSTAELSLAYRILVPEQRRRVCSAEEVSPRHGQRRDLRLSSARQKDQETLGSQTATPHAEQLGLDVPPASTPRGPQFGLAHLVAHPRDGGQLGGAHQGQRGPLGLARLGDAPVFALHLTSTRDSATVDSIRATVDPVAQRRSVPCIVLA
jgi:hypothetical protein